jgi:uncharacterized membrane protein YphA (DoxX/SURF4 family)
MSTRTLSHPSPSKTLNALLWTAQILAGLALLGSGVMKIAGAPAMVQLFAAVGIGQWFRYVTGALEILGALGLLIPAYSGIGAVLLAGVLVGAVAAHLVRIGGSPLHALVMLALVSFVAWGRRDTLTRRERKHREG